MRRRKPVSSRQATLVASVVTAIGIVVVLTASASTGALEPEQGTITAPAASVSVSGASGGLAVKFGSPTPAPTPSPSPGTGVHYFGSLLTPTSRASQEASTMKLAMVEMSWKKAELTDGNYDDDYLRGIKAQIDTFRAAGREVTLGLGYHYTPQWVLDLSQMRNQVGDVNTTKANMVFSQAVRTAMNDYIRHADSIIGFENVWGMRVNTTGGQGEIQYPDNNYWAFSTGAQNGVDKPTRLAANPLPGWKPGVGDVSKNTTLVGQWAMWYQGAIANLLDEQIDTVRSTGFKGYYFLISAGAGERPTTWTNDINNKLQGTSLIGRGVAWDKLYSQMSNKQNVAIYSSSVAEAANYNACTATDKTVGITSSTLSTWSAARWLSRVAGEYGFLTSGENPGYADASNTYYGDTTADGMMARALEITDTCNYLAFFWAHDGQLWGTPAGTSFARYSSLINQVNNNTNPRPAFPR